MLHFWDELGPLIYKELSNTTSSLNKGVKEFEARWIGWAGVNVPDEIGQKALTKALAEKVLQFLHYNVRNNFCIYYCAVSSVDFTYFNLSLACYLCRRGAFQYFLMKRLFINITMAIATTYCGHFSTTLDFHKKTALPPHAVFSLSLRRMRKQIRCLLML